tara:strand:- start:2084 stop:4579 length:2496 start_codon:yes stop_codon:yes gene_type:complete
MKFLSLVDSSLFVSGTLPEGSNSLQYKPSDRDLFRIRSGKFYNNDLNYPTRDNDFIVYDFPADFITSDEVDPDKKIVSFKAQTGEPYFSGQQGENTTVENNWTNSLNPALISPVNNPNNIIGTFPLSGTFFDHVITGFKVPSEITSEETLQGSSGASPATATVEIKYNFYQKAYEFASTQLPVSESLLPSFYSVASILDSVKTPEKNIACDKHLTLNDHTGLSLDESITKLSPPPNSNGKPTIYFTEAGNYFDEYAYTLNNINGEPQGLERQDYVDLTNLFTNQIFQASDIKNLFTDYNDKINNFPMHTKISFSKDTKSHIANYLKATDLFSTLVKDITYGHIPSLDYSFNIGSNEGVPFVPDNDYRGLEIPEQLKLWDFWTWRTTAARRIMSQQSPDNSQHVVMGNISDEYLFVSEPHVDPLEIELSFDDLNESVRQKSLDKTRTYEEILNGESAYNETIFYKIEKWSVNDQNDPQELLQSFYLPNTSDFDKYDFFDTQIKYGQKYIYRIYAYVLVFGNEYKYSFSDLGTPDVGTNTCLFIRPSERIVQVPYFEKLITVVDRPPISPHVNVLPYYGVKNKLLFWLNGNIGNYNLQPVSIFEEDERKFDAIRVMMGVGPNDKINFFSDDPNTTFEVFRLETQPKSYRDFAVGKYTQITAGKFESNPCKAAAAASFVDDIEPNKKYYYTFRAIDPHGNISNPSIVYELEISYDGASPILIQNIINLKNQTNQSQQISRKLKKYLRIRPAFSQTRLNLEKSQLLDANGNLLSALDKAQQDTNWIRLGTDDETLWGKTFKIRIVSRKTGRELDLNVTFELEQKIIQKSIDNKLC